MAEAKCDNCGKEVKSYEVVDYVTGKGACTRECWAELKKSGKVK